MAEAPDGLGIRGVYVGTELDYAYGLLCARRGYTRERAAGALQQWVKAHPGAGLTQKAAAAITSSAKWPSPADAQRHLDNMWPDAKEQAATCPAAVREQLLVDACKALDVPFAPVEASGRTKAEELRRLLYAPDGTLKQAARAYAYDSYDALCHVSDRSDPWVRMLIAQGLPAVGMPKPGGPWLPAIAVDLWRLLLAEAAAEGARQTPPDADPGAGASARVTEGLFSLVLSAQFRGIDRKQASEVPKMTPPTRAEVEQHMATHYTGRKRDALAVMAGSILRSTAEDIARLLESVSEPASGGPVNHVLPTQPSAGAGHASAAARSGGAAASAEAVSAGSARLVADDVPPDLLAAIARACEELKAADFDEAAADLDDVY